MKKTKLLFPLSLLAILALAGCASTPDSGSSVLPTPETSDGGTGGNEDIEIPDTEETPSVDVTGDFSITTTDGAYTSSNSIYKITKAGTYTLTGSLTGQILIEAGEDDEVIIELNGASIEYSKDSPIKGVSAGKIEISAKSGTSNSITDSRSAKTTDNTSVGEGAINAKCDLKLKGSGTLVIVGNYNNGVHTTKDLTIQKQTLHVTGLNNALKGKDSITMVSGTVTAISKKGNGLKTDNTDVSTKGNQRGTITISGGTLTVDSVFDAIDAAYNLVINEDNTESLSTNVTIKTGKYSQYSSNYSSSTSSKGLKASNLIELAAGTIIVQATDDAIHANYGDSITSGGVGQGLIKVSGATVKVASGDDGLHADNTVTVSGGKVLVTGAKEGMESNHFVFTGGETYIYGTDDGINASKKINQTPSVDVSGGYLDVCVSTGDTDGIDSNGNFTQTGGFIVSRGGYGSSGNMSTGLDVDGTAKITGGTFIAFNGLETTPSTGSGVLYAYYGTTGNQGGWGGGPGGGPRFLGASSSSYAFPSGTYTLTGGSLSKTFENEYVYSAFLIYSNELTTGTTYTLKNGSTSVISWTQNSSSVKIG